MPVPEADDLVAGEASDDVLVVEPGNQEEAEGSDNEMEDAVATPAVSEPDIKRRRIQLIEASLLNIQEQLLKTTEGAYKRENFRRMLESLDKWWVKQIRAEGMPDERSPLMPKELMRVAEVYSLPRMTKVAHQFGCQKFGAR